MRETWMADAQSIKIRDQQERIKRLQEAGDAMLDVFSKDPDKISFDDWVAITTDVRTNWRKAKEAKL
jgi:hypothetical protein